MAVRRARPRAAGPARRPARPDRADRTQRRGQDHAVPDDRRPGRNRCRRAQDQAGHADRGARAGPRPDRPCHADGLGAGRCRRPAGTRGRRDRGPARHRHDARHQGRERRREAPCGHCACAGAGPRPPADGRADQPPRPGRDRLARRLARALQGRLPGHQPRPHLPQAADARDAVARPGDPAPQGSGLRRLRGVGRAGLCRRGPGRGQARRQAQARSTLARTRRHRAAQAQPGPAREALPDARTARLDDHRGRHGQVAARDRGFVQVQIGHRRRRDQQELWRTHDHQALQPAHPAGRPHRYRRRQWRGQDHAAEHAHRRARTRQRQRRDRQDADGRDDRPAAPAAHCRQDRPAGAGRRRRLDRRARQSQACAGLSQGLPVRPQDRRHEGQRAVGR